MSTAFLTDASNHASNNSTYPASVETDSTKPSRRRNIDPTTCERDYSYDELEFMQALDEYKRASKRMFPTCSEILEVLHTLGYTKDVILNED